MPLNDVALRKRELRRRELALMGHSLELDDVLIAAVEAEDAVALERQETAREKLARKRRHIRARRAVESRLAYSALPTTSPQRRARGTSRMQRTRRVARTCGSRGDPSGQDDDPEPEDLAPPALDHALFADGEGRAS